MAHTAHEYPANISDGTPMAFLSFGKTAAGLQKDLLQTYQRLNRIWLERMQVEVALWSRFASDLASSKSNEDILEACTDHIARKFKMSAEDGCHIFSDYQEMARKFAGEDTPAAEDPEPMPELELDFGQEHRVTH
jgi:hypothetical protein